MCVLATLKEEEENRLQEKKRLEEEKSQLELFWSGLQHDVATSSSSDSLRDMIWLRLSSLVDSNDVEEKAKVITKFLTLRTLGSLFKLHSGDGVCGYGYYGNHFNPHGHHVYIKQRMLLVSQSNGKQLWHKTDYLYYILLALLHMLHEDTMCRENTL